jgi:hypothetical protein
MQTQSLAYARSVSHASAGCRRTQHSLTNPFQVAYKNSIRTIQSAKPNLHPALAVRGGLHPIAAAVVAAEISNSNNGAGPASTGVDVKTTEPSLDIQLPEYKPSQGLMALVVAGAGPSGLAVAARVSQAGVNPGHAVTKQEV